MDFLLHFWNVHAILVHFEEKDESYLIISEIMDCE